MSDDDPNDALDALARGFRKRTFATMKLVGKVGMSMARRNFGLAQSLEAIDEDKAIAAARKLVEELDSMKGLAMKLGQMMSYLDGSLPPKAQRILAALQASSTPMAPEAIAAVITAELGAPPERIFDRFDPRPFAAASIGQVHRAEKDGVELAVKVQYPGIEALIADDLTTVGRLTRMMTAFSPTDGGALVAEMKARILGECDYLAEATHQERFRAIFAGRDDVRVPAVRRDLTTRRVLTSELVDRWSFETFRERAEPGARDRAAGLLYEAYIGTIFRHGAYNADPHPGNYLFTADGGVTLLDFGCVRYFEPDFLSRWRRLACSILDGDRAGFTGAWQACGFVGRARGFDFDHQYEAMRAFYRPVLGTEPCRVDHAYVAETYDLLMFKNKNRFKLTLPPEWLFINRLQWGLFSVLARLEGSAPWGKILREALA
jgi:predicted unusual protein kinase regulating ubiquinone biosynthesis (AarF/ABC1/UbiB family)